jgi:hypothetical protein
MSIVLSGLLAVRSKRRDWEKSTAAALLLLLVLVEGSISSDSRAMLPMLMSMAHICVPCCCLCHCDDDLNGSFMFTRDALRVLCIRQMTRKKQS